MVSVETGGSGYSVVSKFQSTFCHCQLIRTYINLKFERLVRTYCWCRYRERSSSPHLAVSRLQPSRRGRTNFHTAILLKIKPISSEYMRGVYMDEDEPWLVITWPTTVFSGSPAALACSWALKDSPLFRFAVIRDPSQVITRPKSAKAMGCSPSTSSALLE